MKTREILFRGLKADGSNEWVYGYYFIGANGKHYIKYKEDYGENDGSYTLCDIEVIPETVGQFTGLTDKNGTRIFEGDCIGHKLNVVEYLDGWCINGDRPLRMFTNKEVIGNIQQNN